MEEIFQQVQAATGSGYAIAAAMAGLITVLIKLLARGLDFHDRHIVRKDFERLRMLRESAPDGAPFANYLDEAIQIESFRIASGISTSSAKMAYLLQLASMGRWDRSQLRALSSYILFPPGSVAPTIHLSRIDFFDAVFSLLGGFYFVFAGLFFLVYMGLIFAFPLGWFAGGTICFVFFICALGLWKGFASYQTAKHAKKYLDLIQVGYAASASSKGSSLEKAPPKDLEGMSESSD